MNPSRTRNHLAADLDHLEPPHSRMKYNQRNCIPVKVRKEMEVAAKELDVITQTWGHKETEHGMV